MRSFGRSSRRVAQVKRYVGFGLGAVSRRQPGKGSTGSGSGPPAVGGRPAGVGQQET